MRVGRKPSGRRVGGTLSRFGEPRITLVDGLPVDVTPTPHLIVTRRQDRPGVIGKFGTILGNHGINIAAMQVGRRRVRGEAVMVLAVDDPVAPRILRELAAVPGVGDVRFVVLPPNLVGSTGYGGILDPPCNLDFQGDQKTVLPSFHLTCHWMSTPIGGSKGGAPAHGVWSDGDAGSLYSKVKPTGNGCVAYPMREDLYLRKNTSNWDRLIRGIVAVVLIAWPAVARWSQWPAALVAAFGGGLLVEAITGY